MTKNGHLGKRIFSNENSAGFFVYVQSVNTEIISGIIRSPL